ncbi:MULTISPECIES: phage holin family protein [unclassified Streptomyces]|uniref:phage holin family protein n=1 Tax=unclassified Streptomyces TaxID=2593676 RepID=UPI002254B3F9|nr:MULTISPECIES: phage holin family protein [unclassified Streptomyces]MCX4649405.1 phage holin family protein [Streptomyces sp. NBC_01446]MCX5321396.1 phage holin family protein [Streptomyces sp. NBC_00120]
MTDIGRRRKLGALAGVCIAGALLPGIALGAEDVDVTFSLMVAALVVILLTQLVYVGPSARVPALALLAFGLAGFLQDSLIWWLLSWLGGKFSELEVEGFGTILLAGLITRVSILAFSLIGTEPTAD